MTSLAFDEMLGSVSRLILHCHIPYKMCSERPRSYDWEVLITGSEDSWEIEKCGLTTGMLTANEAIGWIATYALLKRELFGGLRQKESTWNG